MILKAKGTRIYSTCTCMRYALGINSLTCCNLTHTHTLSTGKIYVIIKRKERIVKKDVQVDLTIKHVMAVLHGLPSH